FSPPKSNVAIFEPALRERALLHTTKGERNILATRAKFTVGERAAYGFFQPDVWRSRKVAVYEVEVLPDNPGKPFIHKSAPYFDYVAASLCGTQVMVFQVKINLAKVPDGLSGLEQRDSPRPRRTCQQRPCSQLFQGFASVHIGKALSEAFSESEGIVFSFGKKLSSAKNYSTGFPVLQTACPADNSARRREFSLTALA
ncbi:MAG: hypothetical protein LBI31_06355, partial [Zoogloeaceae bacterium]|nr:hypothetical protein [Zoogloeaceae bacterium]